MKNKIISLHFISNISFILISLNLFIKFNYYFLLILNFIKKDEIKS
jgi:hypothetical protein